MISIGLVPTDTGKIGGKKLNILADIQMYRKKS